SILELCNICPGEYIGLYLPIRNEVDTWPLFEHLLDIGAYPVLPCCREKGKMDFFRVDGSDELQEGKFGIREPVRAQRRPISCSGIKAFILPGVAFDSRGYRLGFGGGYYDRFIADNHCRMLVGAAYHFQLVPEIPAEPWDEPVYYVVTENETRSTY
ncbi:MAG: 5-formyltetrahydrofolate cyclo-ligase, partial [Desulfonatronovibrionaceae bacterium]